MAKGKKKQSAQAKDSNTASAALTKFKMEAAREVDLSLKQEDSKLSTGRQAAERTAKNSANRTKNNQS